MQTALVNQLVLYPEVRRDVIVNIRYTRTGLWTGDEMKILILSTNADEAGAPRHVEALINSLRQKHEFLAVFGESGPVLERLRQSGASVSILEGMRSKFSPIDDMLALKDLIKIVRTFKPDIIHCHSAKAGFLGRIAALSTGTYWVYTVHGWGWRGLSRIKGLFIKSIEKILSYQRNGSYIFVSESVRQDARKHLWMNRKNFSVVYNGAEQKTLKKHSGSANYKILMPARVCAAKDHESVIRAFEQTNDPAAQLILCGSGTDSDQFRKLINIWAPTKHAQVRTEGEVSDMDRLYRETDVVALISNFEALPLTIIEAMGFKKPVIATAIGGIPELIQTGETGILVSWASIDEIASAMRCYKDKALREKHAEKAFIEFNKSFTINSMAQKTDEIYKFGIQDKL